MVAFAPTSTTQGIWQLEQIYIGYYGRAVDASGYNYWQAEYNARIGGTYKIGGVTQARQSSADAIASIASSFGAATQAETVALYPFLGSSVTFPTSDTIVKTQIASFVTSVYQNLFNRAPDLTGLTYWTDQIAAGRVSTSVAILAIGNAAGDDNSTQSLADAKVLNNKIAVSDNFLVSTSTNGIGVSGTVPASVLAQAKAILVGVDGTAASVSTAATAQTNWVATGAGTPGTIFNLTTSVDVFAGGAGSDVFNGQYAAAGNGGNTLSGLDQLDGLGGTDTLNINDVAGGTQALVGISVKNIETINLSSTAAALLDTTGTNGEVVSGVATLNVTAGASATITTGSTTAVNVAGITGAATVTGGSTQTVTAVGAITLSKAAGAIVATDTKQGANNIAIDGGTSVTLKTTATNAGGTTGTVTLGNTTKSTGAISVTSNLTNAAAAAANTTGGTVTVNGGTTVAVTETAVQSVMATAGTNAKIVQSNVAVNGTSTTTAITVAQAAAVTAVNTRLAVTGVTEVDSVQFKALADGDTIIVGGLTYTASGVTTAKTVAAAFANLASGQLTGYTTGAVSGANSDTVVFTGTATGGNTVADTGKDAAGKVVGGGTTVTQTTAAVTAVTAAGTGGVDVGTVTIADPNQGTGTASTISSVTLTNYGASTAASDALTTVSLTNTSTVSASGTFAITNVKATTLDLTVNGGTRGLGAVNAGATYTTLKVHTAGTDTAVAVTAGGVTALTIDGTNALTLTPTMGALKTVTVSGAASVSADFSGATVTGVDVSASTGSNSVILDASKATFTGGTGSDTLTIAAAPTKAINGGAGAGVDTLVLNVAAANFSNPSGNAFISGFETLGLGAAATGTYDATGFTGLTEGAVNGGVVYSNVAAGVGLTITAAPTQNTTYTLKDATGAADSFALTIKGSGAIAAGTVTAASIESITVTATDSASTAKAGGTADSVTIVATSATTMTVLGNTTLTLTNTGNTKLTSVDASGMTGGLTYTTAGTVAETVKGGATTNLLTAVAGTVADVLIGGVGADTLTANAGLDTLTGGAGVDTFVVKTVTANVNTYSTITDATAGDIVNLVDLGAETFQSTKVTLANTAVFQDYANAVVAAGANASVNGYVGWFQFNGDTYVVESMHNGTTTPSFTNGTDLVVKLTGLVNLSTASIFNIGAAGGPLLAIH